MGSPSEHPEFRLGIDVGGTKAEAIVLDSGNVVVAQARTVTRPKPDGITATVRELAAQVAEQLGIEPREFASVGIGIPGIVDHEQGRVESAVNLEIEAVDLAARLDGCFDAPVSVDNDVKATALGACQLTGATNLCYLNIGTGVAGATVMNGELLRGTMNGAGEFGHLSIDPTGEECRCGQRGCVETILGGSYLNLHLGRLGLDLRTLDQATIPAARSARSRILWALDHCVTMLGIAYDPALIVLGGGIVSVARWLLPMLRGRLEAEAAASGFLAGYALPERVIELKTEIPVAALGASLLSDARHAG
jgi:predicted NBD/HSP70 family sugar kinase